MAEAQDDKPEGNKRGPKGPSKLLSDNDFQRLLNMVRIQCTQTEICSILGMSDTTLNRRLQERGYENFLDLYKRHNDEGRMSLRRMQWQAAENGNSTMLVWLGKQYLGQKDKQEQTISGEHVHAYKWIDDDNSDD
jgi:hypothetical protein